METKEIINKILIDKNIKSIDLAEIVNVSRGTMSKLVNGKTQGISLTIANNIVKKFPEYTMDFLRPDKTKETNNEDKEYIDGIKQSLGDREKETKYYDRKRNEDFPRKFTNERELLSFFLDNTEYFYQNHSRFRDFIDATKYKGAIEISEKLFNER